MTDRNNELLLALGYERRRHGSLGDTWRTKAEAEAGVPFSEAAFGHIPRPYDNLQDAVDCVPKEWALESMNWSRHVHAKVDRDPNDEIENVYCSLWNGKDGANYRFAPGSGNTPAEALSEAITKAVSHE